MSRWHESACRHPDIVLVDNLPCCNYCFALAPHESIKEDTALSTHSLPTMQHRSHTDLSWPSVVHFSRANPTSDGCRPYALPMHAKRQKSSPIYSFQHYGDTSKPLNEPNAFPKITAEGEIRLLRIEAGAPEEPVHVHVEVASLRSSSFPNYEILSYTRADGFGYYQKRLPIYIGPYWDVVQVPCSSEEALRSIRRKEVDRTVWVDFLCINDKDVDEKTQQSFLIREILTYASSTLMYLGHASPDSHVALDLIESAASTPTSGDVITSDQQRRTALRSLFQRPYFSSIWVIQEVVLARNLEIVCGRRAIPWTEESPRCVLINSQAPSWLLERELWYGSGRRDLLCLLLKTSLYQCSDPRDKIFGILGLFHEKDFFPDYRISVESVYIGVAAYLIKNCQAFEILVLVSSAQRDLDIPSWVPDWSHSAALKFPELGPDAEKEDELDISNVVVEAAEPIVFDNVTDSESEISIDTNTGSLQIRVLRLCAVAGEVVEVYEKTKVLMPRGQQGTLILSILEGTYQIGLDYIFLLYGWNHPVVLRYHHNTDSCSVVSVCALALGPPADGTMWLPPWKNPSLSQDVFRVSSFSQSEKVSIQTFCSNLSSLFQSHSDMEREHTISSPSPLVEATVLDFSLLLLTGLGEIESKLKSTWNQLEQQLGWMFLDQVAVWHFLQDMESGNQESLTGEGTVPLDELEAVKCEQFCGLRLPSTYRWDLRKFCWSFIRTPVPHSTAAETTWTPILVQLKSQLREVRRWAEVSEQLLHIFGYSWSVLQKSWLRFPGTELPEKWHSNWHRFCNTEASDPRCLWDWSEFKAALGLRALLWERKLPRELDPSTNVNMAARLGLRSMGVELDRQDCIRIV